MREGLVRNDSVAERFDPHKPGFWPPLGRGSAARARDVEPAVRARADACILMPAPVDEIVPAFGAWPCMVGDLVGGQAGRGADLLRGVIERTRHVLVWRDQLAGRMQRRERRVWLDGELIEREMLGGLRDGTRELAFPSPRHLARPRIDEVEGIALERLARDRDCIERLLRGVQAAERLELGI